MPYYKGAQAALHQYITRIIANKLQTVIRINSMLDHIHILVSMTPNIAFLKRFDVPYNPKYVFDRSYAVDSIV